MGKSKAKPLSKKLLDLSRQEKERAKVVDSQSVNTVHSVQNKSSNVDNPAKQVSTIASKLGSSESPLHKTEKPTQKFNNSIIPNQTRNVEKT